MRKCNQKRPRQQREVLLSKTLSTAAKAVEELARAQKELRARGGADKYDVKVIKDELGGEKLVAIDKSNPTKPYVEIK